MMNPIGLDFNRHGGYLLIDAMRLSCNIIGIECIHRFLTRKFVSDHKGIDFCSI